MSPYKIISDFQNTGFQKWVMFLQFSSGSQRVEVEKPEIGHRKGPPLNSSVNALPVVAP